MKLSVMIEPPISTSGASLALLHQKVITFDHDFVAGVQAADHLDAVIAFQAEGDLPFLIIVPVGDEHDGLAAVVQYRSDRYGDGGPVRGGHDLDVREHVRFQSPVR